MRILVTHGGLNEAQKEQIRSTAPGAEVVFLREKEAALEAVREAEVCFGGLWLEEKVRRGPRLRWVHVGSAGVDGLLTEVVRQSGILLTNSRGIFGGPMAEHAFALLLALTRRIGEFVRQQSRGEWKRCPPEALLELGGRTLGLLGYGDIGRAVAQRAVAFGMRCLAFKRRPSPPDGLVERIETDRPGLHRLLEESDILVLSLPLTPATHHLLGPEEFARCKPGALLINVGRGAVCDEAALVQALQEGRLAGAGLDVFEEEPLPPASPLWAMPQVILTPHVAGLSEGLRQRQVDLFCENLRRYLAGQPLRNRVDLEQGY